MGRWRGERGPQLQRRVSEVAVESCILEGSHWATLWPGEGSHWASLWPGEGMGTDSSVEDWTGWSLED